MNNEQNEIIRNMIDKGKRALVTADMNFENEDYDFASSKAYYAVFYFTQAALYTKNLVFSKHSANIAEFNRNFVKKGIFPKEFGEYLQRLFKERQIGDYEYSKKIGLEEARENLRIAKIICEKIENYLDSLLPENLK